MRELVIKAYLGVEDISIMEMKAIEVAGSYLYRYPDDPVTKLLSDMVDCRLPDTLGHSAKTIIDAVLRSEER